MDVGARRMGGFGAADDGLPYTLSLFLCVARKISFLQNSKELYRQMDFGARRMSRHGAADDGLSYSLSLF